MMILGVLFFVSVSQHLTLTYGQLGNCTFREYTMLMRACTTNFFVEVRSDPNGTCSPKFTALKDCAVRILKPCGSTISGNKNMVRDAVERNFKEKTYCDNAGIEFATVYPKVSPVPCAQTYYHQVRGCYNETLKLWQANKADPKICSEYAKAKLCDKRLIKAHCIVYHFYRGAKVLIELHYDDYNPFCISEKTLDSSTNTTTPKSPKAKNTAWSILYQGRFINSFVSCLIIAILGS